MIMMKELYQAFCLKTWNSLYFI